LNRPGLCNAVLGIIVICHAVLSDHWRKDLDIFRGLVDFDPSASGQIAELYIAVTSVAGIAAGLAGVVIVFALQGDSPRFRRFRWAGGDSLRANWSALVVTPTLACLASIVATIGHDLGQYGYPRWWLEAALLLLGHSFLRMIWWLAWLARVVAADDDQQEKEARRVSSANLFR
jgi:hypothetical protein